MHVREKKIWGKLYQNIIVIICRCGIMSKSFLFVWLPYAIFLQ